MNYENATLRDLVADQARRCGKRVFLEYGGHSYSYVAVDEKTDRVATALSRMGLKHGDRIALLLSNRPEFLFFFLGAPKIGVIPVPIDPTALPDEIGFAIEHSGSTAVVTERLYLEYREQLPNVGKWIVVDDPGFAQAPFEGLERGRILGFWPDLEADDPAVISYTRGTTGDPKPVVLTHRNLISNCAQTLQPFRIDETDRFFCALPLSSVAAEVLLVLLPWIAGGSCILGEAYAARLLVELEESRATVLAGTPALYEMIAGSTGFAHSNISTLRLAICYSGPVGRKILRQFEERHDILIVEGYGLVEATCLTCANPYTGVRKPGSLGLPLPGLECRIVDAEGHYLGPGKTGEIVVRGPNVMAGYYRSPRETEAALRGGWLHTGDFGYADPDGYYFLQRARR
ncbi:MAG: AMP-binding protein [Acidobacteria bacterium]|nr:AMP-binding protein [Acidobacteriota bacterium]